MSKGKACKESAVLTREIVMPQHTSPQRTLFGGQLMAWIDMVAAMAALRHAGCPVVTASVDHLSFDKPIHLGDHLILQATVNYVGRSSMEVGVKVEVEHPFTGEVAQVTRAYLTFVGLDRETRQPVRVPDIIPETEVEKRRFREAELRVKARRELLSQMTPRERG